MTWATSAAGDLRASAERVKNPRGDLGALHTGFFTQKGGFWVCWPETSLKREASKTDTDLSHVQPDGCNVLLHRSFSE